MSKKKTGSKGLIELVNEAPSIPYDPNNFSFDDLLKTIDEIDKNDRKRKKQWEEDCKKTPLTELEISNDKRKALRANRID